MKEIKKKVEGGKLLRIEADISENKIKDISITGDFFLHPEEKIFEIEDALKDQPLDRQVLAGVLDGIIDDAVTLIGVSENDIIDALLELS